MSESDRQINRSLANWLFKDVMQGSPGRTLDIGAKLPVLASALLNLGCNAEAIDPEADKMPYSGLVKMYKADLESNWMPNGKFALISLIHTFEHLYEPLAAIRKLRSFVADDGRVFIRLPLHNVAGFERDLTKGHYSIHPFYHSRNSILELLVQSKDCFVLERYLSMEGHGQADLVLKPISRKPIVVAGMIVKNEERDLPRCLKSIEPVVDGIAIVDTGSTDNTLEVATHTIDKHVFVQVYTDASRQDDSGDWKLWDFSKARNQFVDTIEQSDADWLLWMDADDELLTPATLRRATYWSEYDVFGVQIDSGGQRWTHHRLWKTGLGIRYEGRCHEYPTFGGHSVLNLQDIVIRHDTAPGEGENSNARNKRILLKEFEDAPMPRTAFYLANTYKDGGRYADAIPWYVKRIGMGEGYRDEWLFAYLYKARCERASGDAKTAEKTLLEAISKEPSWAEFWMELAYIAYDQKRYFRAIGYALQAVDAPIPATELWREPNKYTDQPPRLISWCYEHLGDKAQALSWAQKAKQAIVGEDKDWDTRIDRLSGQPPAVHVAKQKVIALNRPGAIGDIIMTLNLIPALKEANPGMAIHYYCHKDYATDEGLGWLIRAAGAMPMDSNWWEQRGEVERSINLVGYPLWEGYPNKPMHNHLLQYFAGEMGIENVWDELPALTVPLPKRLSKMYADQPYITWQSQAGWSKYKQWPEERWHELREALGPDFNCIRVDNVNEWPLRETIATFANARMHIGIDSFCNHLTNYYWESADNDLNHHKRRVPGVILWGSTQASAAGYPHNVNISKGIACQPCFRENPAISRMPRGPCVNPPRSTYEDDTPHACMAEISVEEVVEAVRKMWSTLAEKDPRPVVVLSSSL